MGRLLRSLWRIIQAQGGDPRVCDDLSLLPTAAERIPVLSASSGTVTAMDARQIGVASISLGAGRNQKTDVIDPAVGIEMSVDVGDTVSAGDVLCWLHHNGKGVDAASQRIQNSIQIGEGDVGPRPLILRRRSV